MNNITLDTIRDILLGVTGRNSSIQHLSSHSQLVGSVAEIDSVAVVNVLLAVEEKYGVVVHDDEIEQSIFENLEALRVFVEKKVREKPSI